MINRKEMDAAARQTLDFRNKAAKPKVRKGHKTRNQQQKIFASCFAMIAYRMNDER
jgi:hypothetical protein